MLLIAAPGQGAQAPGFLLPVAGAARIRRAPRRLVRAGRVRPDQVRDHRDADEIRDTAIAQPLLVAAAIAAAEALLGGPTGPGAHRLRPAGHSVGELGAGAIAGVLVRRGRDAPGAGARPGHGPRRRGRGHRDDRGARRRRADGPGLDRGARADPGERQRRRPDRRRRHAGAAGRVRRRPAAGAPGSARCRWRAPSTPGTWHRRSTRCARRPPRSPPATRCWRCCPTGTAPWCAAAPTGWSGSSPRSARRSGGTCACRPWPAWASAR